MKKNDIQQFFDILAGAGKANVMYGYIMYYQKQIDNAAKNKKSIYSSPDYFVWLLLNSVYLTTKLENICYRKGIIRKLDEKINGWYENLIDNLKKELTTENKKRIHYLTLVLELRHCFIHYGLPNVIRKTNTRNQINKCQNDYIFAKKVFKEADTILRSIMIPKVTGIKGIITIG